MSQAECFKDLLGSTPVPFESCIEKGDMPVKAVLGEMGISLVGKLDFGEIRNLNGSKLRLTKRFTQEHARRINIGLDRVTAAGRIVLRKHSHSRDWEEKNRNGDEGGNEWDKYIPRRLKVAWLTAKDHLAHDSYHPFEIIDSHTTEEIIDYEAWDRFHTRQEAIPTPTLQEPVLKAMSIALFGK